MRVADSNTVGEAQIRELMADWVEAARAKDVVRLMSHHAPDVELFDVVNPLRYVGVESITRRTEDWFGSFRGPIGYELRDLSISACDDVAFCHSLNRVNATKTDGTPLDMWWRVTVCFRKRDARWLVTHAHSSVPFDPATGRPSLNLKP